MDKETGFPHDFPRLERRDYGGKAALLEGFGGIPGADRSENRRAIKSSGRLPVIMLHGNSGIADNWRSRQGIDFSQYNGLRQNGWDDALLWAVSYQGASRQIEYGNAVRNNIETVRHWIDEVLDYTGAPKVNVIALSMGCHMARAYALGFMPDGSFDPRQRRLDRFASLIMFSGANYGLGKAMAEDWDSSSPLYDDGTHYPQNNNSFFRLDGKSFVFPNDISACCIYASHDYPHTAYIKYGGGHPANPQNTSRLHGLPFYEAGPDSHPGGWYSDRQGNLDLLLAYNHVYTSHDENIFYEHVLPRLM